MGPTQIPQWPSPENLAKVISNRNVEDPSLCISWRRKKISMREHVYTSLAHMDFVYICYLIISDGLFAKYKYETNI